LCEFMGVWMYGSVNVWECECMGVWIYGCVNLWESECMGVWILGSLTFLHLLCTRITSCHNINISSMSHQTEKVKKVKVKWCRYRLGVAQKVGRGIALLFHDRGTRRGWVVSCTLPPGKIWYSFYRRLGGPQVRSGRTENLVPTGIRSRTV